MDRLLPSGFPPNAGCAGGKSKFTAEEDIRLKQLVESTEGPVSWKEISRMMVTRTPRQCRERYKNYLRDELKHENWTEKEDQLIMQFYNQYGKKWNIIARYLPGRTSNSIRNRWKYLEKNDYAIEESTSSLKSSKKSPKYEEPIEAVEDKDHLQVGNSSGEELFNRLMRNMFPQGKPTNIFESDEEIGIFVN